MGSIPDIVEGCQGENAVFNQTKAPDEGNPIPFGVDPADPVKFPV